MHCDSELYCIFIIKNEETDKETGKETGRYSTLGPHGA